MKRVLVSWSSGKDNAWMLHQLQQAPDIELVALMTTFNEAANRVAIHGVRRELVERQAELIGLPLWSVPLPWPCSNALYEAAMSRLLARAAANGITHMAFGDLFLEDLREYRAGLLSGTGIAPLFPCWCRPSETGKIAEAILETGFRAVITCVNPQTVSSDLAGRWYDQSLLAELPSDVDPCGERGEFHSFCTEGPIFREPLNITVGQIEQHDGFIFADVY